ncbi:MAG: DNA helicase-2/ATP-dependent DNA helicase PcrA [Candidatus Midichloriaceae bacterium]|jgi:DNA helicase-2/ATP-dependent DNA helicase PcrA
MKNENIDNGCEKNYLSKLNEKQLEAVNHIDGPILILAGAGTGKTSVLTSRIANLVDESHVFPSQILAVTFTNKAANEMKERVKRYLGDIASTVNMGTFHSIAAKILRKHADKLGYTSDYTIINQDDQIRVIKQILKDFNVDEKDLPPKLLLYHINRFKDKSIVPEHTGSFTSGEYFDEKIIKLYKEYQDRLKNLNAMDFGDLVLNNITLFNQNLEICSYYQNKFKYILVDEYQDTNISQYLWLRLLTQNNNNICCVGDDDQSIYGWRGAEITNILRFDKDYKDAKVVRLEKNYRSSKHILNIASELISNNSNRHSKNLWTDVEEGEKAKIISYYNDKEEARGIADEIDMTERVEKIKLSDMAILVRAGYQTRGFEESLNFLGIPYKIVGNTKFYDRAEVKDVLAYIRLVANQGDNLAFERVVNTPKRGVGPSAMKSIIEISKEQGISYFSATQKIIEVKKGKAIEALKQFVLLMSEATQKLNDGESKASIIKGVIDTTGYIKMWENQGKEEARDRMGNVNEVIKNLDEYETINEFLEFVSLISDTDNMADDNRVNIMTIHSAKGLEFDTVFLPGWEEGIFPSSKSIEDNKGDGVEEERRLAYVAITRAKRKLIVSHAYSRRVFGDFQNSEPSRFINEFPKGEFTIVNNYFNNSYGNNIQKSDAQTPMLSTKNKTGVGTKVQHKMFGAGVIISSEEDVQEVFFEKVGMKKILLKFLEIKV